MCLYFRQINDNNFPIECCSMTDFISWASNQMSLTPITAECPDFGDTSFIDIKTFNISACNGMLKIID